MNERGFDPRAIANAMISYALDRGQTITNVSVQKLLYFAHVSFWVKHKRPLVCSTFEAWEYGPVCRPVYDSLRRYGRAPIIEPIVVVDPFSRSVTPLAPPADHLVTDHIAEVMRALGGLSAGQLIELSHAPGGAWEEVWNKSKTSATLGNRIDDKLSVERFARLKISVRSQSRFGDPDEATPVAGD